MCWWTWALTRGATRVPCWGWDPAGMLFVDSIPVSLISKLSVPSWAK